MKAYHNQDYKNNFKGEKMFQMIKWKRMWVPVSGINRTILLSNWAPSLILIKGVHHFNSIS